MDGVLLAACDIVAGPLPPLDRQSFAFDAEALRTPHYISTRDGQRLRSRGCAVKLACRWFIASALAGSPGEWPPGALEVLDEVPCLQECLSPAGRERFLAAGLLDPEPRPCVLCQRALTPIAISHFLLGGATPARVAALGARNVLQLHTNEFRVGEYDRSAKWEPVGERFGTGPMASADFSRLRLCFEPERGCFAVDQEALRWRDASPPPPPRGVCASPRDIATGHPATLVSPGLFEGGAEGPSPGTGTATAGGAPDPLRAPAHHHLVRYGNDNSPFNLCGYMFAGDEAADPLGVTFGCCTVRAVPELLKAARGGHAGAIAVLADALERTLLGSHPWSRGPAPSATLRTDILRVTRGGSALLVWLEPKARGPYVALALVEYLRAQLYYHPALHAALRSHGGLLGALAVAGIAADEFRRARHCPWWHVEAAAPLITAAFEKYPLPSIAPNEHPGTQRLLGRVFDLLHDPEIARAHDAAGRVAYSQRVVAAIRAGGPSGDLPDASRDPDALMVSYHASRVWLERLGSHVAASQSVALAARLGVETVMPDDPAWRVAVCLHCNALVARVVTADANTWKYRLARPHFELGHRLCEVCRGLMDACDKCDGSGYSLHIEKMKCDDVYSDEHESGLPLEALPRGVYDTTRGDASEADKKCGATVLLVNMRGVILAHDGVRYALCPRLGCASVFQVTAESSTTNSSIMCAGCASDWVRIMGALATYPLERCAVCSCIAGGMRRVWVHGTVGGPLLAAYVCLSHYTPAMDAPRAAAMSLRELVNAAHNAPAGSAARPSKRVFGERAEVDAARLVLQDPLAMPPFVAYLTATHLFPNTSKCAKAPPSAAQATLRFVGVPIELSPAAKRVRIG